MRRPRPRRRAIGVVAVAALAASLLAGCAPEANPSWTPEPWPRVPVTVTQAPTALDPARVDSLIGQRVRNDTVGIQARWMRLPGDAPLNARLAQTVRDAIAAGSAGSYTPQVFPRGAGLGDRACVAGSTTRPASDILGDAGLGPAGGAGTAVACDIVAAQGTFFGERLRVVSASRGQVTADTSITFYTDTASGEVSTADQLWTDAAPAELWADLVMAVRRAHGALSLSAVAPPDDTALAAVRAALAQTVPGPHGTLLITIPAGFTAPELVEIGVTATTEPLAVAISPATSTTLTTRFGTALAGASGVPYAAPAPVAAGLENVDCTLFPCVALTYDDGPSEFTPGILDQVAGHGASVTFFAMGEKAAANASTMVRALAEGNLVENHTWNHPHLPKLTDAQVRKQITDTTAAIASAAGRAPTVFRPPYGDTSPRVQGDAGMAAILWDIDTFDWQGIADDVVTQRAVDGPSPGSIVLQHDIQANTARTAGAVYDGLADRGFTLVNIRQLFGGTLPDRGVWRRGP